MSVNLIEMAKSYLTPELISKAANQTGDSEGSVSRAFEGIVPAVLGGLISKTTSSEGASSLLSLFTQGNHDGSILTNLESIFGGGASTINTTETGKDILNSLFGNKISDITSMLASFSGVKESSASSLVGRVAPVVMGLVGKQVASQPGGFNITNLTSLLDSQKDLVSKFLPVGFASVLGLGSLFGGQGNAFSAAKNMVSEGDSKVSDAILDAPSNVQVVAEEPASSGLPTWLLPLLLGMLVIGAGIYLLRGFGSEKAVSEVVPPVADTTQVMKKETPAEPVVTSYKVKLADGTEIDALKGSLEDEMVKFIEDKKAKIDKSKWFDFAQTLQFETGQATLKPNPEAEKQLTNLLAILKAYPKVKIKIGGYTDNSGNPNANKKLSQARAETVFAALLKRGGSKTQLTGAEGYGMEHPVAPNDTEENKAKNRRVSVSVREK